MPSPVVARLWIAAAEHALDAALAGDDADALVVVRSRVRDAAVEAEEVMNSVAGPPGPERSAAVTTLVRRFGNRAVDVNYIAAAVIAEAVASGLVESGIAGAEAGRIADHCRAAVLEACAAIDTLTALTTDP